MFGAARGIIDKNADPLTDPWVLETLRRFVIEGDPKLVAEEICYEYISKVICELRSEVDIVNMGLKLLSDIMKYLIDYRENLLHLILDCIQAYAPPAVGHRKRDPIRLYISYIC